MAVTEAADRHAEVVGLLTRIAVALESQPRPTTKRPPANKAATVSAK